MQKNTVLINNIKDMLEKEGMSQSMLADEMGVTRALVSAYLLGKVTPNIEKLERM